MILYQSADSRSVRAVRVTAGQPFRVGPTETRLTVPAGLGSAWDVDRSSGRIVVSEPVVADGARIVVMQHWLDEFRRTVAQRQ
jgi:S1-C subfamily serine protease